MTPPPFLALSRSVRVPLPLLLYAWCNFAILRRPAHSLASNILPSNSSLTTTTPVPSYSLFAWVQEKPLMHVTALATVPSLLLGLCTYTANHHSFLPSFLPRQLPRLTLAVRLTISTAYTDEESPRAGCEAPWDGCAV